jgi:hypothetical protein
MKNFLSSVLFLLLFATASAQSTETIGYYYQGKKVYFPVSYDRIVVGVKPGNSIGTLKSRIGGSFGAETDSITESFAGKQILIKNGRNKEKDIALKLLKLKTNGVVIRKASIQKCIGQVLQLWRGVYC